MSLKLEGQERIFIVDNSLMPGGKPSTYSFIDLGSDKSGASKLAAQTLPTTRRGGTGRKRFTLANFEAYRKKERESSTPGKLSEQDRGVEKTTRVVTPPSPRREVVTLPTVAVVAKKEGLEGTSSPRVSPRDSSPKKREEEKAPQRVISHRDALPLPTMFSREPLESKRVSKEDSSSLKRAPQKTVSRRTTRQEGASRFTLSAFTSYASSSRQSKSVEPGTMRGIPNYASNCFAISAYQLVKNNPALYNAIFKSPAFIADPRFKAFREFDAKYDSGQPLSTQDMQRVRTACLTQFRIPAHGHQDPYEVLTAALFSHIPGGSALYSRVTTRRVIEFTVPSDKVDTALLGLGPDCRELGREEVPRSLFNWTKQTKVRLEHTVPGDPRLSLELSLKGVKAGSSIQEVLVQDLSDTMKGVYSLPSGVETTEASRDFTIHASDHVMITLKRFDDYGNKISTPIDVPSGKVQFDSGNAHEVKGFMVHLGISTRNGHCIEYQKIGDQWFLNNDGQSKSVTTETALAAMRSAYVLYAERS
ncbi:MAG: ubiquitin carboxyl-terminal hydrolase [Chlamydiia bacterium]|nr:ubiquitin carboxyl-terminal hydrolase [Chlamydiia bacterium]